MVLMFLSEAVLSTGWWSLKKTYELGYYMVYGNQETTEQKLLKVIDEIQQNFKEEHSKNEKQLEIIQSLIKEHNQYIEYLEKINKNIGKIEECKQHIFKKEKEEDSTDSSVDMVTPPEIDNDDQLGASSKYLLYINNINHIDNKKMR
jgi:hypothetical protein